MQTSISASRSAAVLGALRTPLTLARRPREAPPPALDEHQQIQYT